MNELNCLLEIVGELDDAVLENAFKPRRKKYVAIIAIAAAALSLLVGFTVASRSGLFFEDREQISFNYYPQTQAHILTDEEFTALGAVKDGYDYRLTVLPSELFALYNVTPLMNDEFFSEETDIVIYNSLPVQTRIHYTLTDKESGKPLKIDLQFTQNGEGSFAPSYGIIGGGKVEDIFSHYETITLADGSEGFVADRYMHGFNRYDAEAVLCHNGIGYRFRAKNTDIGEMKIVLEKLGVTEK